MASTSAVSMAAPFAPAGQNKAAVAARDVFFQPLRPSPRGFGAAARLSVGKPTRRVDVRASRSTVIKEKAVAAGLTAAALAAAFVVPEIAEAAQPGMSASLKNFLFSIFSGGVVLTLLFGAVVGVSNFDPVKRT